MASSNGASMSFLEPNLGEEIVTLIVGEWRKKIVVHKRLLCRSSEFFMKGFQGGSAAAKDNIMHLAEDRAGAVALFINWLYRRALPEELTDEYLPDLYNLWAFATKICLIELADSTMDIIQCVSLENQHFTDDETVQKIWSMTPKASKLRQYIVDLRMHQVWEERNFENDDMDYPVFISSDAYKSFWKLVKDDEDLFEAVLENLQFMARRNFFGDPRAHMHCHYHSHFPEESGGICSRGRKN